jgi:hypothetical protein
MTGTRLLNFSKEELLKIPITWEEKLELESSVLFMRLSIRKQKLK